MRGRRLRGGSSIRRARNGLALLLTVGLGAGAWNLLAGAEGGAAARPSPEVTRPPAGPAPTYAAPVWEPRPATPPPDPAPGPADAVARFLDAEARRDFVTSYTLLAPSERERHRSPASWAAFHSSLAPVSGFRIVSELPDEDRTTIRVELLLEPSLDEVIGLVPARADATLVTERAEGGWLVVHSAGKVEPIYTPDTGAGPAVEGWAAQRQQCGAPAEYRGGLIGVPALADRLCRASRVRVGAPRRLAAYGDAAPLVSAFGPDVTFWAREVPVESDAVSLRAVVAPLCDNWLVVGVLPSAPAEGR
jgi:hypothetical protein